MTLAARVGVLGGTFDPIHRAHLAIAAAARDSLALERVLFVPAGDPWRKRGRAVTPARQRLAMVEAAVANDATFAVADLEVRRPGPSYTVETLAALRAEGYGPLWFIVGSDSLLDLPHWREPPRLLSLARLAAITRPGAALEAAALDQILPGLAAALDWVPMAPIDLSATELRRRLASGEEVRGAVPGPALAYIRAHGLYAARTPSAR